MAKITLHVPDLLIAAAKREAESRKTSVSKLVSDYFRVFAMAREANRVEGLPPITASLIGCLKGANHDHDACVDHLERKHS